MHPENAYQCANYFFDKSDTELYEVLPLLEQLSKVKDVRPLAEKRSHFEEKHGVIVKKEVQKPSDAPDFEEIDLEEFHEVTRPKAIEVKNTLKSKKTLNSSSTRATLDVVTRQTLSYKSSFPSTVGRDSYESSDESLSVNDKSINKKKNYKTSVFQERDESDISEDENQGKQTHRSIAIQHKEKSRSKALAVIN